MHKLYFNQNKVVVPPFNLGMQESVVTEAHREEIVVLLRVPEQKYASVFPSRKASAS